MTHTGPSPLQELELVEDVWRGEAQDLLSQIAQLQEENKQLMTNLSHKDVSFSEEEFQKHEGKRRGWLGRWGERLFPSSSPASPVSPEDGPERRVSCHVHLHHHMPGALSLLILSMRSQHGSCFLRHFRLTATSGPIHTSSTIQNVQRAND